jgi:predicted dienelactone hydrolase
MGDGLARIQVPTLVIGGSLDATTPWDTEALPIYQGLETTPRWLAEVDGAGHFGFTHMCDLLNMEECHPPYLEPERVQDVTNALVLPFLETVREHPEAGTYFPPEHEYLVLEGVP